MKFYISAIHVKKENRKSFLTALFFILATIGCVATLFGTKEISSAFFPLVGIFVFIRATLNIYKKIKEGSKSYPVIELDENTGEIAVTHKDITIRVDIKQAKSLRIQHKSNKLQSAIITTASGEIMRFEGYENLDQLVSKFEYFIPKEKTTNAKFFHK